MSQQYATNNWNSPRWGGIIRTYSMEDVNRLRGTVRVEYSLARAGAEKFWRLLHQEAYIPALGALTGNQAVEMAQAGLKAIYLSGWQVAADANLAGQMYPDQSLYPANSVPSVVRALNSALLRADQIAHSEGSNSVDWMLPIVADAEAGFGGVLNAFELMKSMIEAGAAAVHFEDQLSSAKKCGHMGGKVLVPTRDAVQKLVAARLAADVLDVPTVLIARTDADAAKLITSDCDPVDQPFLAGKQTVEGFFAFRGGLDAAISRGLAYAPYADIVWCETSQPNMQEARRFAEAIHEEFPGKLLAYNCSPSFHWKSKLSDREIAHFQQELGAMGYRFQFVTLAGFHSLNLSIFELAHEYARSGMSAYSRLQQREFELAEKCGYGAVKHQRFVGTGYFDELANVIASGQTSIRALPGSTEEEQFEVLPFKESINSATSASGMPD
ncbi:isocitrate lyase [Terriglobus albidus]|uniref:Isocitrate lyase n=1 Tax=Terriglobus albidus TaxID=1592106 RepID=A0A5B9EEG9_9BACT|nr:isocitrate lyase [Terriglobus albidus]QEE30084.1 isocitrate lyase [Terriglobus albidus]